MDDKQKMLNWLDRLNGRNTQRKERVQTTITSNSRSMNSNIKRETKGNTFVTNNYYIGNITAVRNEPVEQRMYYNIGSSTKEKDTLEDRIYDMVASLF